MSSLSENTRLETFCDGVIAIAITILILEIKIPPVETIHSVTDLWTAIARLWPSYLAFVLSFTTILISWVGHHAIFKFIDKSSSYFLFANGFFLLTIVVIPFPTALMAEYVRTSYAQPAIVLYCFANLFHNVGWNVLIAGILKPRNLLRDPEMTKEMKGRLKGARFGFIMNSAMTIIAIWLPYIALVIITLFWAYWLYSGISAPEENNR